MQVHDLIQGSPEWLEFRAKHFGASEAGAMLGLSKTMTRPELLHMKATGLTPEFTAWVQKNVLDHGHHVEELTLPLIEKHIGDELYPATCSEGVLSASCDGLNMTGDIAWENKQPNTEIVAQMKAGVMPLQHMPQCQQVLMVTGAKKLIFSVSDGTPESLLMLEVLPDPEWFKRLRAGWSQFNEDLVTYTPPTETAPVVTGRAPETLPALFIAVKGEVTDSNLADFKEVALAAIRSVNRDLQTDQDFADAGRAVKWCDDVEKRVAGAKQHALSQTATIDTLFKTMDDISAEARQVRLDLEKLIKARTVSLKTELLTEAQAALSEHIVTLNTRLGRAYMPPMPVDFAGAITSKRNFDSMRAALDATLANAKIAANAVADNIDINLKVLREQGKDHGFLFNDVSQIVLKAPDDLQALVKLRISEHQTEVARKEEETKTRLQNEANAAAEQRTTMLMQEIEGIQQQVIIASSGRAGVRVGGSIRCIRETLAETEAWPVLEEHFGALTVIAQSAKDQSVADIKALLIAAEQQVAEVQTTPPAVIANSAPTPAVDSAMAQVREVVRAATPATAAHAPAVRQPTPADTPPTLSLGQIGTRLGFNLTAAFLSTLGFDGEKVKGAVLFHESSFVEICDALDEHIVSVRAKHRVTEAA